MSKDGEAVLDGRRFVIHDGGEFDVKMGGEPIGRPHFQQQVLVDRVAQRVLFDFRLEEGLAANELLVVAVVIDTTRPIVSHHHVDGFGDLLHAEHLQIAHVIGAAHRLVRVRRSFKVTASVIVTFVNPGQTLLEGKGREYWQL